MSGKKVFYPMGFDDNGLPTKRLVEKRRQMQPTLWYPADRTALAQAEIKDKEKDGTLWTVSFDLADGGTIEIATTRPDLLGACGAVMIHPDHPRAKAFPAISRSSWTPKAQSPNAGSSVRSM
jgi:valyl-tRNA synthetase